MDMEGGGGYPSVHITTCALFDDKMVYEVGQNVQKTVHMVYG